MSDALKEFAHFRERFHPWQKFFAENFGAVLIELFSDCPKFFRCKKLREVLI